MEATPHKHLGKTPEAVENQLKNLQQRHPNSDHAIKHGAYAAERLRPIRAEILAELEQTFPGVRRDRLELAAGLRARIKLMHAYIDAVGIIRNRKRGEFFPVVATLAADEKAYKADLAKIEELHKAAGPDSATHRQKLIEEYASATNGD